MKNGPYELVVAPQDYPGMKYRGRYCYEHHLVYWQSHGILPGPGEVIHHINEDRRDNSISNLELMDGGEHTGNHHRVLPTMIPCSQCEKLVAIRPSMYRYRSKCGQKHFYCNRSCMGRHYGRGRPIQ